MFAYAGLLNFFFQAIALGHLLRWFRERTLVLAGFLLMAIGVRGHALPGGVGPDHQRADLRAVMAGERGEGLAESQSH